MSKQSKLIRGKHKDVLYVDYMVESLPYNDEIKAYIYHYAGDAAKRCCLMRGLYYSLNLVIIVLPVLTSLIDVIWGYPLSVHDIISIVLSSIVTISAGILSLLRCHEQWTRNRSYLEKMLNIIAIHAEQDRNNPQCCGIELMKEIKELNTEYQSKWQHERNNDNKNLGSN